MKKIIFTISFIFLFGNCHSQTGWFNVQSGTTYSIRSLSFVDNQTGWICGESGMIKKTTNGGYNWFQQPTPTPYPLYTLFFINENTGWAGGGYVDYYNGITTNTIVKTTNGGINWILQLNVTNWDSYYTKSIYFIDANTGFAGSYGNNGGFITGTIAKTTNGGINWVNIPGARPSAKIIFQNNNTGWSISHVWTDYGNIDTGKIYKTTNGGANWFVSLIQYYWTYDNIFFFNSNTGIVQGHHTTSYTISEYLKTTNAGINWFCIYNENDFRNDTYFLNENTGWSCGYKITKTTNGGYNWFTQTPNFSYQLYGITFKDSINGFSVGEGGNILKTITGGITRITNETENIYKYNLYQNFPNPFNPTTKIKFDVPRWRGIKGVDNYVQNASLKVYDILGKEIATLVNEKLQPGTYEVPFSINQFPNNQLNSGVYFYRLIIGDPLGRTDGFTETKKMLLIK